MSARSRESIDRMCAFEKGCVASRLQELTMQLIAEYTSEDVRKLAQEQRLAGNPVTMYPLGQAQIIEKFGEKARAEAFRRVEQEKTSFVDHLTPYIKATIERNFKRLRWLVYDFDDNGKVFKVKVVTERIAQADHNGNWDSRDVKYVGDRDVQRYEAICGILSQLSEFKEYAPYMSEELSKQWREISELGNLEEIRKEDINAAAQETAKTEETEAQS